ncbi:hypothetical protein [Azorhizophilus paspali]|uniref:Uncharacterized protein n=1 Tax=Azorhizophilus paspali TaxID=69963 RepID=A0ABV6SHM5_AZOPA
MHLRYRMPVYEVMDVCDTPDMIRWLKERYRLCDGSAYRPAREVRITGPALLDRTSGRLLASNTTCLLDEHCCIGAAMWIDEDKFDLEHQGLLDREADKFLRDLEDDGLDYSFEDEVLETLVELEPGDEDGWDEDIESWDDL